MPDGSSNVELTCTRKVCHVLYSVPPEALGLLRGVRCPTCKLGILETRKDVLGEAATPAAAP
jgi:hypothetical protein